MAYLVNLRRQSTGDTFSLTVDEETEGMAKFGAEMQINAHPMVAWHGNDWRAVDAQSLSSALRPI